MPNASPLIVRRDRRPGHPFLRISLAGLLAGLFLSAGCTPPQPGRGVYRAGPNAVIRGARTGTVKVWGPEGTVDRVASEAPGGNTFVGAAGPLWIVDRDVPAPPKAPIVTAVMVERAGFRLKELLGTTATGAVDAAKAGGVYVRSTVKVRRDKAPPVYLIAATGDTAGSGRMGGPADVRSGENCKAGIGVMDDKGDKPCRATSWPTRRRSARSRCCCRRST